MKKIYLLVILLSMGITQTQIYAQCFNCDDNTKAFTIGTNTTATGDNSFAGGNLSTASGINSFAFGYLSTASELRGIAVGNESKVLQTDGIAIGNYATSNASNSYVFGQNLSSTGANSITIGLGTSSSQLLSNSKPNSLMFGVTHKPSLTIVKPASGGDVGYVGIGTETPQELVHINNGNLLLKSPTTSSSAIIIDIESKFKCSIKPINQTYGSTGLAFSVNEFSTTSDPQRGATPELFLGINGRVGIGTTSPTTKLDVAGVMSAQSANIAGLVKAKEIKVTLSDWPDFVFINNYNLMPLNELEQFVTENHHLPNVPSAADVEANGIELGAMNATLLEKIEELTLYIIDLQKQINELKTTKIVVND